MVSPLQSSKKPQQKRLTTFFGSSNDENAGNSKRNKRQRLQDRSSAASKNRPSGSGFQTCPLCQALFPWHTLERHASNCDGQKPQPMERSSSSSNHNEKPTLVTSERQISSSSKAATTIATENPSAASLSTESISYSTRTKATAALPNTTTPNIATTVSTFQPPQLLPAEEPIPGLFLYPEFISEQEEAAILNELDHHDVLPWKTSTFNGKSFGKRWGVHCNLRDRRVDAPQHGLPTTLQQIVLPKLARLEPMFMRKEGSYCKPNEANAIDYRRKLGHWLKAHVDDRSLSKEPIANLSLAGDCYMTFQNQNPHRNLAVKDKKVLLKRRCLQILTGKTRYDFSHGIAHADLLTDRRVSVTMRESPLTLQPVIKNMFSLKKDG